MRTVRRAVISVGMLGLPLMAAACDAGDDDDGESVATAAVETSARAPVTTEPATSPPTTPPATTSPATSTATEAPTTSAPPPPSTIDEEALKKEIAEDLVAADRELVELVSNPSAQGIEDRVSRIAAPGPYFDAIVDRVESLLAARQRVIPGEPPVHRLEVEAINLRNVGEATVITCRVDNSAVVRVQDNGSHSVVTPSQLAAVRDEHSVVSTPNGWLISSYDSAVSGIWPGEESCP